MKLSKLTTFDDAGLVRVVIESPRGSMAKFKYDSESEVFTLSRPLVDGVTYPYDWGFIPSTRGPDGDPLDALVLWDRTSFPGIVHACRVIGVLRVEQNSRRHPGERERNDRLFAVPAVAEKFATMVDVDHIVPRMKRELEAFFLAAVALEHKDLKVLGWDSAAAASDLVRTSAL